MKHRVSKFDPEIVEEKSEPTANEKEVKMNKREKKMKEKAKKKEVKTDLVVEADGDKTA